MQVCDKLPKEGHVVALVQCGPELRAKPSESQGLVAPTVLGNRCQAPEEKLPALLAAPAAEA